MQTYLGTTSLLWLSLSSDELNQKIDKALSRPGKPFRPSVQFKTLHFSLKEM